MELKIYAGMRILYKDNNQWQVGTLDSGTAFLTLDNLLLRIIPNKNPEDRIVRGINELFFDAVKLDDWVKDYPQYFMNKEDYIKLTEEEDFDRQRENAYVSDGEYIYYPVSKFSKSWIEKQPFDYIVRSDL